MDIKEFEKKLVEYLEEYFKDKGKVIVKDFLKNNGIVLRGITVELKGVCANPTAYVEDCYEDYLNGAEFDRICLKMADVYENARLDVEPDLTFMHDAGELKKNVYCKLINTVRNETLLENVPHMEFLNLSAVFYVILKDFSSGYGTILLDNGFLKGMDITIDELYECAVTNNRADLGTCVVPMEQLLLELAVDKGYSEAEAMKNEIRERMAAGDVLPMFVVTNKYKHNGAACMLDDVFLNDLGDTLESDFFILPSSIHELIVIPGSACDGNVDELKEMVKTVNCTELAPGEILSDSIYMYDREAEKVLCF